MAMNNYFLVVNLTGSNLSATINNISVSLANNQSSDLKKFIEGMDNFMVDIRDINIENTGTIGRSAYIPDFSTPYDSANPSNQNSFTVFEFTSFHSVNVYVGSSRSHEALF